MHKFSAVVVFASVMVVVVVMDMDMMLGAWTMPLVVSNLGSILSSSYHKIELRLKYSLYAITADLRRADRNEKIRAHAADNIRVLNTYTQRITAIQSLTQELYGIIEFQEETTAAAFQELYDEYVESYFSLNVDPTLLLDSKITVTNVLLPSIDDRYLKIRYSEGNHDGSSVIITYDQELSYYFPIVGEILALETLVTLPFLTESGRDEFSSKLKDSDDIILQDVLGVSEVSFSSESSTNQPVRSPTEPFEEPLSVINPPPQSPVSKPTDSSTQLPEVPVPDVNVPTQSPITQSLIFPTLLPTLAPTKLPTVFPSKRRPPLPPQPTYNDGMTPVMVLTKSQTPSLSKSTVNSLSNLPAVISTPLPAPIRTKVNSPSETNADSDGISGLIIIGCLMVALFFTFTINMQYCMGEYVD